MYYTLSQSTVCKIKREVQKSSTVDALIISYEVPQILFGIRTLTNLLSFNNHFLEI